MTFVSTYTHEKRSRQDVPVAEFFRDNTPAQNPNAGVNIVKILSGHWHVSTQPGDMLVTILGSCVSACIRDVSLGIGGMNHFLLPGDDAMSSHISDAARYGVFAMENLINAILKNGGRKDRFEIKVFGGGNVINNSSRIGSKNAQFIRTFLRNEGFRIASEDLEGEHPRRLHYFPDTGRVMMRLLRRASDRDVIEEEARYTRRITTEPVEGDIELF